MEEDHIKPETVSAFNAGYTLQKHEPQLLDKVLQSSDQKNEYVNALASGKKQFERDKIMEQQQHIKEKTTKRNVTDNKLNFRFLPMALTDDEEYEKGNKIGYELAKAGSVAVLDKLINQEKRNSIFREGLENGHFAYNEEQYIKHFGKDALSEKHRELGGDVDGYYSPHHLSIGNSLPDATQNHERDKIREQQQRIKEKQQQSKKRGR